MSYIFKIILLVPSQLKGVENKCKLFPFEGVYDELEYTWVKPELVNTEDKVVKLVVPILIVKFGNAEPVDVVTKVRLFIFPA